jgi:hypothetical protein
MIRKILLGLVLLALVSCAPGVSRDRVIHVGQWTPVIVVGKDTFLVEGFSNQDAINGASQYCAEKNQKMALENLSPNTSKLRAILTFKCQNY